VKLTDDQKDCLVWLVRRNGEAIVDRYGRLVAAGETRPRGSWIAWLRLVAAGMIAGGHDRLTLTAEGRQAAGKADTMEIKTPQSHPDHPVVGHRFKAWDGQVYRCDSHDPRVGYWMTREDCPPEHFADEAGKWRRNVSERAIGRTYHEIP
jgi:hypothetical protein